MRKEKIVDTLFVPIKNNQYIVDKHYRVKTYKNEENAKKYTKEYDKILHYVLIKEDKCLNQHLKKHYGNTTKI